MRLIAPFVFLLLALFIQKALDADNRRRSAFADVAVPTAIPVSQIPDCTSVRSRPLFAATICAHCLISISVSKCTFSSNRE